MPSEATLSAAGASKIVLSDCWFNVIWNYDRKLKAKKVQRPRHRRQSGGLYEPLQAAQPNGESLRIFVPWKLDDSSSIVADIEETSTECYKGSTMKHQESTSSLNQYFYLGFWDTEQHMISIDNMVKNEDTLSKYLI